MIRSVILATGESLKIMITGVIFGVVSKKYHSLPLGIVVRLALGLVLAYLVAMFPDEQRESLLR